MRAEGGGGGRRGGGGVEGVATDYRPVSVGSYKIVTSARSVAPIEPEYPPLRVAV